MRIVSLLPSSTEIVCQLGFENQLVGRSHECDFPPSVTDLPILTAPKFDPTGTSGEVDERVRQILQEAVSVYRLDEQTLHELAPDIIITQTQCEVCAVSFDEVERVVCDWLGSTAQIIALEPNRLSDVLNDMARVADVLGAPERGADLITTIRQRLEAIANQTALIEEWPSVATIEWIDPLMTAGHWLPELVEIAGGVNLFGEAGHPSPYMMWEELVAANPEVIVVLPCGYDIEKSWQEMAVLTQQPEWWDLRAVQFGQVYITDGNHYFNRPGPRLVESAEILAEILHPSVFHFGHEGSGWVRFE